MKCLASSTKACSVYVHLATFYWVGWWISWQFVNEMFGEWVVLLCLKIMWKKSAWVDISAKLYILHISWYFENDRWVGLGFRFIQSRWLWIWQYCIALAFVQIAALHKLNVQWVALKIVSESSWCFTASSVNFIWKLWWIIFIGMFFMFCKNVGKGMFFPVILCCVLYLKREKFKFCITPKHQAVRPAPHNT